MSDLRPVPRNRRSDQRAARTDWNARPRARSTAPKRPPKQERPAREKPAPQAERPQARFPGKAVLLLMLLALVAFLAMTGARGKLQDLRRQRAEEAEQYEKLVSKHIVNETRPWIEQYALENGIEPAYVAAVIYNESTYRPGAVSEKNARGLMQIMPGTFSDIRKWMKDSETTYDDMFDPEKNIRYGCYYLGLLSREFDGDPIEIACAYNAGHNTVQDWILRYSKDGKTLSLDDIPDEKVQDYAKGVYDAYSIYFQHYYPDPV